jgi:hypothetical protein
VDSFLYIHVISLSLSLGCLRLTASITTCRLPSFWLLWGTGTLEECNSMSCYMGPNPSQVSIRSNRKRLILPFFFSSFFALLIPSMLDLNLVQPAILFRLSLRLVFSYTVKKISRLLIVRGVYVDCPRMRGDLDWSPCWPLDKMLGYFAGLIYVVLSGIYPRPVFNHFPKVLLFSMLLPTTASAAWRVHLILFILFIYFIFYFFFLFSVFDSPTTVCT